MGAFATGLVLRAGSACRCIVDLLVGLAVGGALGALAGVLIARTGVNSFVVTLALSFALVGLVSLLYSAGSPTGRRSPCSRPGLRRSAAATFADYCIGDVCGPDRFR